MASFGHLLRRYRTRSGLTQEELAEVARISVRSVTDLERGVSRSPHKDTVIRLADALRLAEQERGAFLEAARGRETSAIASTSESPRLFPPLTSLIGREREEAALVRLLRQERLRLLTLMGPAGVGKTRLAMQVALTAQEDFPDGVFFVELAALRDPALLLPALAQPLGVQERGATPLEHTLTLAIGDRQLLLVLDNLEHLLPAAPSISRLLARCPSLKALVTSRAALRVRGEHRFLLAPLAFPDPDAPPELAETASYPAVTLFCQRAQAVKPDFALHTQTNAQIIGQLCRCLDGLPLAIELAAARLSLLTPQEILACLTDAADASPLDVLGDALQDLPDRQQSVRKAIEWSYMLLDEEEQEVFHAVCLFESGVSLAALCAVTGHDEVPLLAFLGSLIDKSLVLRDERDARTRRFTCLELLRAYGRERLQTLGETGRLQTRFATYYLALVEQAERRFASAEQGDWLHTLDLELPHLRATLHWCLENMQIEQGLRMVAALRRYWALRGFSSEGRRWAEALLAQAFDPVLAHARARALLCAGDLAHRQGAYIEAKILCRQGLALMESLREEQGIAFALALVGKITVDQGYYEQAEDLLQQSLARFRRLQETQGIAFALNILGGAFMYQGKTLEAIAAYEEALALERQHGDLEHIARTVGNLGIMILNADRRRALPLLEESLRLAERIGVRAVVATNFSNLGHDAFEHGEFAKAAEHHRASLKTRRVLGELDGVAFSLCNLGNAERALGHEEEAIRLFHEALPLMLQTGSRMGVARLLEGLATEACVAGQMEEAARLWGQSDQVRRLANCPDPSLRAVLEERHLSAARHALGLERYEAAFQEGRQMAFEAILEELRRF